MKEIKINNTVKAPWVKLKTWRDNNVKVWNDPALQAYLTRKEQLNIIESCMLVVAATSAGMLLEVKLIFG